MEEIFQYKIKQIPNAQDIEESIAQTHDIIAEKAYKAIRDVNIIPSLILILINISWTAAILHASNLLFKKSIIYQDRYKSVHLIKV